MDTLHGKDRVKTGADHSTPGFAGLADLASARVGGKAVAANDEFFAPKSNLVKPPPAIFVPGKFTARGKWMDGWETRRRRTPGHDWCVVALGMRGRIRGVNVDTSHFTGNFPSHCSIDVLDANGPLRSRMYALEGKPWRPLVDRRELRGNGDNFFASADGAPCTHVRLNIFPDGGVARLRVYGEVEVDWTRVARSKRPIDLASIRNGGLVLGASDMHFGARDNMIMPGRAANMGDGWETRRRRGPAVDPITGLRADWAVIRLGAPGIVHRVEIDTNHFRGNYPESAAIEGCFQPDAPLEQLAHATWVPILPQATLRPSRRHFYAHEVLPAGAVSHVRLNIFPDGGISRLRVYGTVAAD
jgi:allantoicase